MSVKNKAKDRDANGRIKRRYTGPITHGHRRHPVKGDDSYILSTSPLRRQF